jgi:hypoxanthine phosphoribosyltransferase
MKKTFKDKDEYKEGDVIISAKEVDARMDEVVKDIVSEYKNKRLLLVGLLTGAAWLTTDLLTRLHIAGFTDVELMFIKIRSYENGTNTAYEPRIEYDTLINPKGRHVLIVDDIADTGKTLQAVLKFFINKNVASVRSFVLVNKPSRRQIQYKPNYAGFEIPDIWVQGRGMDSDGFGRGDPNIRKGPYLY